MIYAVIERGPDAGTASSFETWDAYHAATFSPYTNNAVITNNGKIHAHDANGQRHVIHALDSPPARYIKRIIKGRRPA